MPPDCRRETRRHIGRRDRRGELRTFRLNSSKRRLKNAADLGNAATGEYSEVIGIGAHDRHPLGLEPAHDAVVFGGERQIACLHFGGGNDLTVRQSRLEFIEVAHRECDFEPHRRRQFFRLEASPLDVSRIYPTAGIRWRRRHRANTVRKGRAPLCAGQRRNRIAAGRGGKHDDCQGHQVRNPRTSSKRRRIHWPIIGTYHKGITDAGRRPSALIKRLQPFSANAKSSDYLPRW